MNIFYLIKNEHKQILKEYLTYEGVSLLKYFNLSDKEKKKNLPFMYSYVYSDFKNEYYGDLDTEIPSDFEDYEWVNEIYTNNKPLFDEFAEYLFDKIEEHSLDIMDAEYPAWSMLDNPNLVKNQWLIHFTNDADSITSKGFIYGVDELDKLGLTTHFGEFEKKYGGYNFSYLLTDFYRYGYEGSNSYKYGNEAVIFRASGVKLWHHGDSEYQVIFYGKTAKNMVSITSGEDAYWSIRSNKSNEVLYENDDLRKVVSWFVKNYDQYRKHL
jgi:hypothetical protein